jgi:hypothetical protein
MSSSSSAPTPPRWPAWRRSAAPGITDLRHGSILDEDWRHGDRFAHAKGRKNAGNAAARGAMLCRGVHLVATRRRSGRIRFWATAWCLLRSALGQHKDKQTALDFPRRANGSVYGMNHMDLLDDAGVHAQLREMAVLISRRSRGISAPIVITM